MTPPLSPDALALTHAAAFGTGGWDAGTFRDYLDKPFHWVFGDADCFAVLKIIADEGEILTLATHPDQQRQGRACALLTQILTATDKMGVTHLFLDVAEDNAAARALYMQAGFEQFATRRNYYVSGADAICMNIKRDGAS